MPQLSLFLLLIISDVQSLTQQSKLEAVVKTLAPALLAELVKINPAPSTSRAKKDAVSEASQQKMKVDAYSTTGFVLKICNCCIWSKTLFICVSTPVFSLIILHLQG